MLSKKSIRYAFFWTYLATGSVAAMADLGGFGGGPLGLLGTKPDFASLDVNGDGEISDEERTAARTAEFKKIDADSDGYLTDAEITAYFDQKIADAFATLDTDDNSALSESEFVADKTGRRAKVAKKAFKLADTDANSSLSLEEFTALQPPARMAVLRFAEMDTDNDGKVSQAEFLAQPEGHGRRHGGHGPRGF